MGDGKDEASPKLDDAQDLTRFRVVTSAGVLVIYDAAIPPDVNQSRERKRADNSDQPSFVAYWNDFATEYLYVFDRLLFTPDDAAVAVESLQRDFVLDPDLFASDDLGVSRLSSIPPNGTPTGRERAGPQTIDDGSWQPGSRELVLDVMGFATDEEGVGGVAGTCWPIPGPESLPIGPIPAPPRGASLDVLLRLALAEAGCGGGGDPPPTPACDCCWGITSGGVAFTADGTVTAADNCCGFGGACNDGDPCTDNDNCNGWWWGWCPGMPQGTCCGKLKNCDDRNACTLDSCVSGVCVNTPRNCNDNNACTTDGCDSATGCFNNPINCNDGDVCTNDGCFAATGCDNGPKCVNPDRPQCCGFAENEYACCMADQVCCRYRWAGEGHPDNGCCPPNTTCCGAGCCDSAPNCCNGDCRQGCEAYCCPGGWCEGECCNGGCCGLGQICCEGQCCGSVCNPGSCECADSECLTHVCVTTPACDDGNPCTDDICTPGTCGDFTCTHPCKPDCAGPCPPQAPVGWYQVCACVSETCSISVGNGETCPGSPAEVIVSGGCAPVCINSVAWQITSPSPYITGTSGFLFCAGKSLLASVGVAANAPLGQIPITITGTTPLGGQCFDQAIINVTPEQCSVSLSSATGKPCETLQLTLTGDCWPDCGGNMALSFEAQYPPPYNALIPPWLVIIPPPSSAIECAGGSQTRTISVLIHGDAPPGPVPIVVTATTPSGQCQATGTVTVDRTYDTVLLEYNTFIAPELVLVDTGADPLIDKFHQGDRRWFGQHPTSRSRQTIGVRLDPTGGQYTLVGAFGTSYTYSDSPPGSDAFACEFCPVDFDDYEDWCLAPSASWECRATAVHGAGGSVAEASLTRPTTTSALVNFHLVGKHPCLPETMTPAIDANLWLEFRQECTGNVLKTMELRAFGVQHDGFPWHELIINGVPAYQHDPCCTRETPGSLFGSGEWTYSQSEADPCHTPLLQDAIQNWQPVPGLSP